MVADIVFEIAVFVFIMLFIGIILTIFEFIYYVNEDTEDESRPVKKRRDAP